MLRRLRFRPIGWLAAVCTLAAMGAALVVAAPSGAAGEKTYEVSFEANCILAPGVLNQKGVIKVHQVGHGPATVAEHEAFSLTGNTISVTTPKEWGESFYALGSRSVKGYVLSTIVDNTNAEPAKKNIAKPTEFPTGLPLKTKVEDREVEFTVPSEERTFTSGPYTVTGHAGEEGVSTVDTAPGYKEVSAGKYEATGEGILSEDTGYNENGEANVGPIQTACTAPANVVVAAIPITAGPGSTTTSASTTTSKSTTTTTSTTPTTTTTSSTTTSSGGLKIKLNDILGGYLRVKKLENQKIVLPEGCTFIGEGEIPGPFEANTKCPPFSAKLKILGLSSTLGTELVQASPVKGTITPQENGKLLIKGSTKDNIKLTSLGLLGINLSVSCETAEPVTFPLDAEATATELLTTGATSTGFTTLPSVRCGGLLGGIVGPLVTILMSGPNNEFQFTIKP